MHHTTIRFAILTFWIAAVTFQVAVCKHISIFLLNTSSTEVEFRPYTGVPHTEKDFLVKQVSYNTLDTATAVKECLGSARMVCDPSNIFSKKNKHVIEETIVGICSSSTCHCGTDCSRRQYCPGIQTTVVALQLDRNDSSDTSVDFVQSWKNSNHRCHSDLYISLLLPYNATETPDIAMHMYRNEEVAEKCKDHVIRKTQKMIGEGDYGLAIIYQIQLYRHILLGEYSCNEIASVLITMETLIGLIYLCVCLPIMGCVTMVFLSNGMRGKSSSSGSKSLAGYRRDVDLDWSQDSRKSSRM